MANGEGSSVSAAWARVAAGEMRKSGIDLKRALREAGLEARTINNEAAWIPFVRHAALMEIAARELQDDCYGAKLGARIDPREAGALAYIGVASRTLGDGLRNFERYSHVVTEAFRVRLKVEGNTARILAEPIDPAFPRFRQAVEFGLSVLLHAYRRFTRHLITPIGVSFIHSREKRLAEMKALFGCPVRFGRSIIGIELHRRDLAIPIPTSDDRLLKILRGYCDEVLSRQKRHKPELLQKLERRIVDLLPSGRARNKVVATDLGLSERTLNRRLNDLGTSFADIVDGLRHELALRYLNDRNLSLTQISFLLGYAGQSAFSTAFRRWTGRAPKEMRRG
jgi:AraC-like DNA-binding protein